VRYYGYYSNVSSGHYSIDTQGRFSYTPLMKMALQRERLYKNTLNALNCADEYFSIESEEVVQFQQTG